MSRLDLGQPVEITTSKNFSRYGRAVATGKHVSMVCTTANRYMWVSNKKLIPITTKSLQKLGSN